MTATECEPAALAVGLDEVKAYLRIDHNEEDALLAGLIRSATGLCEMFTGQTLIARPFVEPMAAEALWRRLTRTPVQAIEDVSGEGADGEALTLPTETYAIDIDHRGDGWVKLTGVAGGRTIARLKVRYRAGMGNDWNGIAAPLRQGIVRLVAHMHLNRDDGGEATPPATVAALWRPWRRMHLR